MSWFARLSKNLRSLFRRQQAETELDEELRFHLEAQIAENLRAGMSPAEARRAALLALGGVEQVKEYVRDQRAGAWLETLWQDVRYGARMLRRSPSFTFVAVLTLALGIGANTAMFSIVDAVLLRPLPYPEPNRVVMLWQDDTKNGNPHEDVAPANFVDWRAQSRSFEEMAAINPWSLDYTGGDEPESIRSANVTRGFFEILRVQARYGRTFASEEHEPGRNRVVVLTDGFWRRKFGRDPGVVGRVISLDDQPYTVVGILPPEFSLLISRGDRMRRPEMFAPQVVAGEDWQSRVATYIEVVARLKPGVSLEQARAEMHTLGAQLRQEYPRENAGVAITVVPLHEQMVGAVRPGLLILLGAVGLVLLIACANVANLLLARGHQRQREIAVRSALGASRVRLVRQLLTESFLLSFAGLLVGLLLARALLPAIVAMGSADTPRLQEAGLDVTVLGFAALATSLTTILFGVIPSLQLAAGNLQNSLKEGATGAQGGSAGRLRSALIVSEVALAVVLLIGSGLLVRSFTRLLNVERGFEADRVVALEVYVWDRYESPERRIRYFQEVAEKLSRLPGVKAAGAVSGLPFLTHTQAPSVPCNVEGKPPLSADQAPTVYAITATPDYFRAMGIAFLNGRTFTANDNAKAPRVAIVNTTMARQMWPGEDPLGRKFTVQFRRQAVAFEVIGIVGDVRYRLDRPPRPEFFRSHTQDPHGSMTIVARTGSDPAALLQSIKMLVWEVNPTQPFYSVAVLGHLVSGTLDQRRFQLLLLGSFSGLALLLAAVGIYGVLSFATARRTPEIGVRVALGATPGDVLRLVMGDGMRPVLAGLAVGLLGGLALTRVIAKLLYGVTPYDPATFATVALLLTAIALAACYVPARRATRVDPMVALRYE